MTTLKNTSAPDTTGAPTPGAGDKSAHSGDYTTGDGLGLALRLAGLSWYVFPCREKAETVNGKIFEIKSPYTPHGKNDATTDVAQIQRWWKRWPEALVGVYCEKSGFFAVDVDNKNGHDGAGSWGKLTDTFSIGQAVVYGPVQYTPSMGCHLLFKLPEGVAIPNNADKLGDGLDLRSNGYICTGTGYEWMSGHEPETPLNDAPAWLLEVIRNSAHKKQPTPRQPNDNHQVADHWLKQALLRASIGTRNETGFWLACQLRDAGLLQSETEGISYPERVSQGSGQAYTRREWEATVKSAYSQSARSPARASGNFPALSGNPPEPPNLPPIMGGDELAGSEDDSEDPILPLVSYVPELPKSAAIPDELLEEVGKVGAWLKAYMAFGCQAAPMAPAIFHQVIGQTLLSTVIARRVYLRIGNDFLYPNTYALIVANSTLYTKSTAFQVGKRALEKAGLLRFTLPVGITPQSLVGELTNRAPETFADWEKGDQDDWREERPFSAQRAWLMDESASLLDAFNQKTTADLLTHVLKLYDCPGKLTAASTVGRGRQTIRSAYLTICGPTTPAAMRVHLSNRDHWGNGLFARFIFVTPNIPPVRKFFPEPCDLPDEISRPLRLLALERLEVPKEIALGQTTPPKAEAVKLDDGVWAMWNAYHGGLWELMLSHQVPEKLFPNYGRLHTTAMKFAMQLAAMDWAMAEGAELVTVTRAHFAKAVLLAEDYRASLHRMVEDASQPSEDEDQERKILNYLDEASKGLTTREVSRCTHMATPIQRLELDQILERMKKDGLIIQTTRKRGRGPEADVWVRNPSRVATL